MHSKCTSFALSKAPKLQRALLEATMSVTLPGNQWPRCTIVIHKIKQSLIHDGEEANLRCSFQAFLALWQDTPQGDSDLLVVPQSGVAS